MYAAGEDRAHDLRIMRPTRCQLRYCRPESAAGQRQCLSIRLRPNCSCARVFRDRVRSETVGTHTHTHTHTRGALRADMGLAPTCSIPCCHLPRPVRLVDCYRPLCRSTWKHTLDSDKLLLQRRVGCRSPVGCPVVTPRGMTQPTTAPLPRSQLRQVRIELTTLGL